VRRGVALGGIDAHSLDLERGIRGEDDDSIAIPKSTAASMFAVDAFVENIRSLRESRDDIQRRRQRGDHELTKLFRLPLHPNIDEPYFTTGFADVVAAMNIDGLFATRRKIAIATGDSLTPRMAGPAIRAWQIALALSREHDVRLVSTVKAELTHPDFDVYVIDPASMAELEAWCDVFVFQGYILHEYPVIRDSKKVIVCDIYDPMTGRIKIKGFYDDVIPPSKSELNDWINSGFSARDFKKAHHLKLMRSEDNLEVMKRIWGMPTMEIHGVVGGYQGPGVKSIVPPRAEVKGSFRLVPVQDPIKIQKQLKAAIKELNPDVQVHFESGAPAFRTVLDKGPLPAALKRSMKFAFKRDPVFVRDGGTIGAMTSIEKVLKCPVLFLGLSLPEHGYHAPNENFDWQQASGGIVAFAKYFEEIANLKR